MIVRIVTMTFKVDAIELFKDLFDKKKEAIRNQPGCLLLELYQDIDDPQKFSTYSYWESVNDLNNYRYSQLFKEVWPLTKAMFYQPAVAISYRKMHSLL